MSIKEGVRCLKDIGFSGPYTSGKNSPHPAYMVRGNVKLNLPNPHKRKDIGIPLLNKLKKKGRIKDEECTD